MALRFASCLYLALLFPLVSSSALPPPPQDTPEGHEALFESSQVREVSVLPSLSNTWSLPSSTPAASFDEVEEQFKNLTTFKPPTCNGAAYGRGLSPESCHEALLAIPHETRQLIFGKRGRGRWNINLPYRVLSSWAVITSCVGDNKREGGIAEKIGTLYSSIPPMIAMFQPSVAI
ncbi:MAG: hypothetical protein L6R39_006009 [Caloplaca ligustica]|nr:MAG: hypothetical protein L6R39_006009 [Caloplaca ligustica]